MAIANLGKIKPLWRGDYSSTETYRPLDFLKNGGVTYICTVEATGIAPPNLSYFEAVIDDQVNTMTAYAISQLAGGDAFLIGVITSGTTVDSYDWMIYPTDGRIYEVGSVTGTLAGDFDPDTGVDTGLSGALVNFNIVDSQASLSSSIVTNEGNIASNALDIANLDANKLDASGVQSVTGSATFTNSTNNINLTDIGAQGWEVGDVIQVSGSVDNDELFTIEFITDDDNVVVNYEHRGGTTSKSLVDEIVTVTCSLVCKWYLAGAHLGRDWCVPSTTVGEGTDMDNDTNRPIEISYASGDGISSISGIFVTIDGLIFGSQNTTGSAATVLNTISVTVPEGSTYSYASQTSGADTTSRKEFR